MNYRTKLGIINKSFRRHVLRPTIEELQAYDAQLQHNDRASVSTLSSSRRAPFEVMRKAFEDVSKDAPFMPSASSVLPALLALRKSHQTIAESKTYLNSQQTSIDEAYRRLEHERASLADQRSLTPALENRIVSLKEDAVNMMELEPEQVAQEALNEMKQKKEKYDKDTTRLFRDLNKFVDSHLAAQLAAEDLGGPIVGDRLDIDSSDIIAGFNAQGRPKKAPRKPDDDKRQRRLEEVWGPAFADRDLDEIPDEMAAAGHELRDLTEELLNRLMQSGGDSTAAYVTLPKETAAARFLVRSKVAQFHPRDAARIKLIDFGKELDD